MVTLRLNGLLDWVIRRWKLVVLLVGAPAVFTSAAAFWQDVPTSFSDFRQVVSIVVKGESLPALHAQLALLGQLVIKERAKERPNWRIIQHYESLIRNTKQRILEVQKLSIRYRLR